MDNHNSFREPKLSYCTQRVIKLIMADKVNYVVDTDIRGLFENINHDWIIKFLEHNIVGKNFILQRVKCFFSLYLLLYG